MNMRPRDLPVFGAPVLPTLLTDAQVKEWLEKGRKAADPKAIHNGDTVKAVRNTWASAKATAGVIARNVADWQQASPGTQIIEMLGHSMKAVAR